MNIITKIISDLKSKDTSPDFYKHYPFLFHPYFQDVAEEVVENLSKAGYMYYHAALGLDAVFDRKELSGIAKILTLHMALYHIISCSHSFIQF
jgi:hypothetical protein